MRLMQSRLVIALFASTDDAFAKLDERRRDCLACGAQLC